MLLQSEKGSNVVAIELGRVASLDVVEHDSARPPPGDLTERLTDTLRGSPRYDWLRKDALHEFVAADITPISSPT